jgi:hypothetical protein
MSETAKSSRRLFLRAGSAAAVFGALGAAAAESDDPIFAAIREHRRLVDFSNERGIDDDECDERSTAEADYIWEVLLEVEPTTLAGVCALLIYIADDVYPMKEDDDPMVIAADVAKNCLAKMDIAI